MIFRIIFNYILGFVNITVEGFFVERFINNCINNKVFLWGIKRKSSTLMTSNVNIKDFKKIRNIARKTKCKVNINSKKGFPIILHRYRKRKLLLLISIPIILAILISSRVATSSPCEFLKILPIWFCFSLLNLSITKKILQDERPS